MLAHGYFNKGLREPGLSSPTWRFIPIAGRAPNSKDRVCKLNRPKHVKWACCQDCFWLMTSSFWKLLCVEPGMTKLQAFPGSPSLRGLRSRTQGPLPSIMNRYSLCALISTLISSNIYYGPARIWAEKKMSAGLCLPQGPQPKLEAYVRT